MGVQVLRDVAVRFGLTTADDFDRTVRNIGTGVRTVRSAVMGLTAQIIAFEVAARTMDARLGRRALQWNLRQVHKIALTTAGGIDFLTNAYNRFRGGMGLLNEQVIENARYMVRQAEALKLNTDEFQQLSFAFEQYDLTQADVVTVLERFARGAETALEKVHGPASQAYEDFVKLGISVERLRGKSALGILEEVAHAYKQAGGNQQAKNAIYRLLGEDMSAIFGETLARRLIPAMAGGAEGITDLRRTAQFSGLVVDQDMLEGGKELALQFGILTRQVNVFWQEVGLRLVPATKILVGLFQDLILENKDWINLRLDQAADFVTASMDRLDKVIRSIDWRFTAAIVAGALAMVQLTASMLSFTAAAFIAIGTMLLFNMVVKGVTWLLTGKAMSIWAVVFSLGSYIVQTIAATLVTLGFDVVLAPVAATALVVAAAIGILTAAFAAMALLMGGALIGLVLAIDDFFAFLQGGDSFFGRFIDYISTSEGYLAELGKGMYEFGRAVYEAFALAGQIIWEFWEIVLVAFGYGTQDSMQALKDLMEWIAGWMTWFAQTGAGIWGWVADTLKAAREQIQWIAETLELVMQLAGAVGQIDLTQPWTLGVALGDASAAAGAYYNEVYAPANQMYVTNYISGGNPDEVYEAQVRASRSLMEGGAD